MSKFEKHDDLESIKGKGVAVIERLTRWDAIQGNIYPVEEVTFYPDSKGWDLHKGALVVYDTDTELAVATYYEYQSVHFIDTGDPNTGNKGGVLVESPKWGTKDFYEGADSFIEDGSYVLIYKGGKRVAAHERGGASKIAVV